MTELVKVSAGEDSVLDVVFVHGLDGDARRSWSAKRKGSFWPEWLAQDVAGTAVWSLGYDAASSRWLGHAMPIQDRAINLLAHLENHGIGQRPLCFVTHSMGGLVVKEMLLHAAEGRAGYTEFANATRGVVFLATPHIGSNIAAKAIVKALAIVYRTTRRSMPWKAIARTCGSSTIATATGSPTPTCEWSTGSSTRLSQPGACRWSTPARPTPDCPGTDPSRSTRTTSTSASRLIAATWSTARSSGSSLACATPPEARATITWHQGTTS